MRVRKWDGALRALAVLVVGLGVAGASSEEVQKIPHSLPFNVSKQGFTVESAFEVHEEAWYGIDLTYLYGRGEISVNDRTLVWHLVGGSEKNSKTRQWEEPGAPLELEILLRREEPGKTVEVLRRHVVQPRLSSWGEDTLTTELAAARLPSGRYHLIVRSLAAAPMLQDIRARIDVIRAYRGK